MEMSTMEQASANICGVGLCEGRYQRMRAGSCFELKRIRTCAGKSIQADHRLPEPTEIRNSVILERT
jgi:hypothetical protein